MSEPSPLVVAQQKFAAAVPLRATAAEQVGLADALGRTLAADVTAPEAAPPYPRAIAEGFVVHAASTQGASEESPRSFKVVGACMPGDDTFPAMQPGEAVEVACGSLMPDGPVSVARMWEAKRDGNTITVVRPFPPRFFIEEIGCDMAQGATVAAAGTVLGPDEIGVIAAQGIGKVAVAKAPTVTLFASGDEVVPFTDAMRPGIIRDSNTPMLAAAIAQAGGVPVAGGIMKDDFKKCVEAVNAALQTSDMVVIAGGTAVGGRDFVSDLLREVGTLLVDGVPMKSGRPLIMGLSGNNKPIVCVAGHPPEALRGFRLFGQAAIDRLLGRDRPLPEDMPQ
ncbi:MAG: molybdopterin molybdotransferase MoeA [Nitrospirota bacterium]|nr:molybdopterin molybdotransferase MoeA [Nitrospirota bacterium]